MTVIAPTPIAAGLSPISLFTLFRSEMARLMLAGFLVGGLAVAAVHVGDAIAAAPVAGVAQ